MANCHLGEFVQLHQAARLIVQAQADFRELHPLTGLNWGGLSLAGSVPGRPRLLIDGDQVFSGHSVFEGTPTLTNTLAKVHIAAGQHVLTLIYSSPILMPGSDVATRFGPIFLSTQFAGDAKVKQVSISRIPKLCTENLDWIATTN